MARSSWCFWSRGVITTLGEIWQSLHGASYARSATAITAQLPALWDPVLLTLLACPAWLFLAALAGLLFLRARRGRR